jgi:hypothetical protein
MWDLGFEVWPLAPLAHVFFLGCPTLALRTMPRVGLEFESGGHGFSRAVKRVPKKGVSRVVFDARDLLPCALGSLCEPGSWFSCSPPTTRHSPLLFLRAPPSFLEGGSWVWSAGALLPPMLSLTAPRTTQRQLCCCLRRERRSPDRRFFFVFLLSCRRYRLPSRQSSHQHNRCERRQRHRPHQPSVVRHIKIFEEIRIAQREHLPEQP